MLSLFAIKSIRILPPPPSLSRYEKYEFQISNYAINERYEKVDDKQYYKSTELEVEYFGHLIPSQSKV